MQVEITDLGAATIIRAGGRIDSTTSIDFERRITAVLKNSVDKLIVNLKEVEYVSSAGLRVFLMLAKQMKATQGHFVICEMPKVVHHVFRLSGFLKIIRVVSTEEEALASTGGSA